MRYQLPLLKTLLVTSFMLIPSAGRSGTSSIFGATSGSNSVTVNVGGLHQSREISPWIYGIGANLREGHRESNVWSLRPAMIRWGGNTTERFNWRQNAWNTGADWFFMNVSSKHPNVVDFLIADNKKHGAISAITIPTLGWVAKDQKSVSFPVSTLGPQQGQDGNAGNGMDKNGKFLNTRPEATSVPFTSSDAETWVRHLTKQMPDSPRVYFVGNEPMLWNSTHRDVHPQPATYEEVTSKYIATARAIRTADPTAIIAGPALWGWLATEYSAFDATGPWSENRRNVDRERHGGKPFLEWFLSRVIAEEKSFGKSLIDVIDVHYYPENKLIRDKSKSSTDGARLARLRGTKSLWDDTYKDESWIDTKIRMIPRLHDYAKIKPGLGVCIGEYNFYGEHDIGGAIALAEVLSIFARQRVTCAAYWTFPPEGSPTASAFKLLRNFDGQGGSLGSLLLPNNIETTDEASVLTTYDKKTGSARILILNKTLATTKTFKFNGLTTGPTSRIQQYSLTSKDPSKIVNQVVPVRQDLSVEVAPLSAHVLVINDVKL